jgi:hypothetical protein
LNLAYFGSYNSLIFEVTVCVDNYYTGTFVKLGTVTVSKTLDDFVTFGGNIKMVVNPTSNTSAGLYPSDLDSKVNFGGSAKYNKNGTNLQGGVNFIFRSGGITYQVKGVLGGSNGSLSVNVSNANVKRATIVAKANITYAETGLAVPNTNNSTMTFNLRDRGEPGVNDSLSIEIKNGSGQLVYSSNWTGTKTNERRLTGGNIQIRGVNSGTVATKTSADTTTIPATENPVKVVIKSRDRRFNLGTRAFEVKTWPNPSTQYFTARVESSNTSDQVVVKVFDISGKLIRTVTGAANSNIRFGEDFITGIYIIEVSQGNQRRQLKVMKQSD